MRRITFVRPLVYPLRMLDYLNPWMWQGSSTDKKKKRDLLAGALRGEPSSLYELGQWAFRERQDDFAAKWLDKCVVLPSQYWPKASVFMGTIHYRKNNFSTAEHYWKQAAEQGNSTAMFNLAVLYKENNQVGNALNWFSRAASAGHAKAQQSLDRLKSQPAPATWMTENEAEHHAARWMKYWGFYDAKVMPIGPDGGIDVVASNAQAQVKYWNTPVGIQPINEFEGASSGRGSVKLFFSKSGYSKHAVNRADQCNIALFTFDSEHIPKASNSIARDFLLNRN